MACGCGSLLIYEMTSEFKHEIVIYDQGRKVHGRNIQSTRRDFILQFCCFQRKK